MPETILEIENLRTYYHDRDIVLKAVDGISLKLERGEILGLVGESGCGKTTVGLSILNLVAHPGRIESGRVLFHGRDLLEKSKDEMREVRGRDISMIFQSPAEGLNPVLSVGAQVEEMLRVHRKVGGVNVHEETLELLARAGLPDPRRIANRYPFELSGGMAQRVMIAIATAMQPSVLIADEPTSALDTTVQAQILAELRRLRDTGVSILLITHDLGVIAQMADRVLVMYAGRIAEHGSVDDIFYRKRHPYSVALMDSLPRIDDPIQKLRHVQGIPPNMTQLPDQCAFAPRCSKALNNCRLLDSPPLEEIEPGHFVACFNPVYLPADDGEREAEPR